MRISKRLYLLKDILNTFGWIIKIASLIFMAVTVLNIGMHPDAGIVWVEIGMCSMIGYCWGALIVSATHQEPKPSYRPRYIRR